MKFCVVGVLVASALSAQTIRPSAGTRPVETVFWTDGPGGQTIVEKLPTNEPPQAGFPDLTYAQTMKRMSSMAAVMEMTVPKIEQLRKGGATIEVRTPAGEVIRGANLAIEQVTHEFKFGNYIRPRHYKNQQYLSRFKELFNFIQLLEFNWGQYEVDEGNPQLESRLHFLKKWAYPNGLRRLYGHMLVWSPDDDREDPPPVPAWSFRYDKAKQYQLLKERIQREMRDYRDHDMLWDVVNEALHCRVWGDWDKPGWSQNANPEPMDRIFPYVRDALMWAHEANPKAKLMINEYAVIPKGNFQDRYRELIDRLQKEKVPLHAVGIQGHEPFKGAYWNSPQELWDAYDRLGTQTGLPIHITELFQTSDETKEIRGGYRTGKWNQLNQADAIEEFTRVSFAHPALESIIYFGMADDGVVQPKVGLLDEQYRPKLVWNRLKSLIWEESTTRERGRTSDAGGYGFRGFYGEYDVTVSSRGKTRTFRAQLAKGKENRWQLVFE